METDIGVWNATPARGASYCDDQLHCSPAITRLRYEPIGLATPQWNAAPIFEIDVERLSLANWFVGSKSE
ncbi:hypothetical protein WKW50_21530 [Ochrobactrum sp. GPK 3]